MHIANKSYLICVIFVQAFQWSQQDAVATVHTLDQRYILCADYDRDMVLVEALRQYREENEAANVMIFTNTKKCVFAKYFYNVFFKSFFAKCVMNVCDCADAVSYCR